MSKFLCKLGDWLGTTTGVISTIVLSLLLGLLPVNLSTFALSELAIWMTAFILKAGADDRAADKRQQDLQVKQNAAILAEIADLKRHHGINLSK